MSSSLHRRSAEEFDKALSSLDDRLSALNIHIEIKAIGGYALLKHGIRQGADAVTVDIDSLTREYTGPVSEAIKQVAEEQRLEHEFRCPVHPHDHSAAMHLKWGEFNGFLYCELCGRHWPEAVCCADLVRATHILLDTVREALQRGHIVWPGAARQSPGFGRGEGVGIKRDARHEHA